MEGLVAADIHQIIVVTNYRAERIQETFGDGSSLNCEIQYVKQKSPRGTADAVGAAASILKGEDRFFVIYGDDYYEKRAVREFLNKAMDSDGITMATA